MSVHSDVKIVDNVFVKMMRMNVVGDKINGHAHTFDHITLLSTGRVIMRVKGDGIEHTAPKLIVTPKGIVHEFEALEPNSVLCCIHAIRDGDGEADIAPQDITEEQADLLITQFPLVTNTA